MIVILSQVDRPAFSRFFFSLVGAGPILFCDAAAEGQLGEEVNAFPSNHAGLATRLGREKRD